MVMHEDTLPIEYHNPFSDCQRSERCLRNQFKYVKRQSNLPSEVRCLLEQIASRNSQGHAVKVCLGVLAWMDGHDNQRPSEWKSYAANGLRDECILARRLRKLKAKIEKPVDALLL